MNATGGETKAALEVGFTFEEKILGLLLQNLRREGTSWNNVHCL